MRQGKFSYAVLSESYLQREKRGNEMLLTELWRHAPDSKRTGQSVSSESSSSCN